MPRSVCPRQKFHCCQIASGSLHESSEIVPQQLGSHAQQDSMLNCASAHFTRSPAMFFTLFARATVAGSLRHTQPYVLVKETLNEFDQSSGRIVSGLLHQNRNDFHEKQVSVDSNESRGIFLFCLSTGRRCLHECEVKCDDRSCSPFSRKSLSFPRPMTHSSHHGAGGKWFKMWCCRSTSEG